jgi:hypothetical protein
MAAFPEPKLWHVVLLVALLIGSISGSLIAFKQLMNTLPTTGYLPTLTLKGTSTLPSLENFVDSLKNGQKNTVVGIYVPGVLALPVGQQPQGNSGFVTRQPKQVTQFSMARQYGTVGILAHNDLAGADFDEIKINQYAIVIFGDGHEDYYLVTDLQKFQALSPTSTFSDFINLDGSKEHLTASQVFSRIYAPGGRLVFQTCIEGQGDPSWGRMFIIAEPAAEQALSFVQQTSFMLEFSSFGLAYR